MGEEAARRKGTLGAAVPDPVEVAIRAVTPDGDAHLVIALALHYAKLDRLPDGGPSLLRFLAGPLRAAFEATCGAAEARLQIERLGQALAPRLVETAAGPVSSGVRPAARRAPAPSDPAPRRRSARARPVHRPSSRPSAEARAVFFVSEDTAATARLVDALADSIPVSPIRAAAPLMEGLRRVPRGTRLVVILDCRGSMLGDSALSMFSRELPAGAQVILWGSESRLRAQLSRARMRPDAATLVDAEATCAEIALIVAAVIG